MILDRPTRYRSRWWAATQAGFSSRIGGRWGGPALLGPLLLSGGAALWVDGFDAVTAGRVASAVLAGVAGVVLYLVFVLIWSAIHAPSEIDAEQQREWTRLQKLFEFELDNDLAVAKAVAEAAQKERDEAFAQLAAATDPKRVIRSLIALDDDGESLGRSLDVALGDLPDALDAFEGAFEAWVKDCGRLIATYRPQYLPRFREAQIVPYRPSSMPRLVREKDEDGTEGPWVDMDALDRARRHVTQIRTLVREMIDAG